MEAADTTKEEYIIFQLDKFNAAVPSYADVQLIDGSFKPASSITVDDDIDEDFLEQYKE
jgi:hypothetical protein